MYRVLLKKQLLEINQTYFVDRKTGKRRPLRSIILYVALGVVLFLLFAGIFYSLGESLAGGCIDQGQDWLYFALMGAFTLVIAAIATVFNTYSMLFHARDAEMLLSLPIPPRTIVAVRLTAVVLLALVFSAVVWVPGMIAFAMASGNAGAAAGGAGAAASRAAATSLGAAIAAQVLDLVAIVLIVTVVSCLLGWIVALGAGKIKNKSLATTIFSVVAICAYLYVYFLIIGNLEQFVQMAVGAAGFMSTWGLPLAAVGRAATGDVLSLVGLLFSGIVLLVLAFAVLSKSFVRISTTRAVARSSRAYTSQQAKSSDVKAALLRREARRFVSTPVYLLNTGLGVVFMMAAAVIVPFQSEMLLGNIEPALAGLPELNAAFPVLVLAAVLLVVSIDAIAAPSVSLEGKELWIIRSLPVSTRDVLEAKLALPALVNGIPAVLCTLSLGLSFGFEGSTIALMVVAVAAYVRADAAFCLMIGVAKPMMAWTNVVAPVKQSLAVAVAVFGGMGFSLAVVAAYSLVNGALGASGTAGVGGAIGTQGYLVVLMVVLFAAEVGLRRWLNGKGVELFEAL